MKIAKDHREAISQALDQMNINLLRTYIETQQEVCDHLGFLSVDRFAIKQICKIIESLDGFSMIDPWTRFAKGLRELLLDQDSCLYQEGCAIILMREVIKCSIIEAELMLSALIHRQPKPWYIRIIQCFARSELQPL